MTMRAISIGSVSRVPARHARRRRPRRGDGGAVTRRRSHGRSAASVRGRRRRACEAGREASDCVARFIAGGRGRVATGGLSAPATPNVWDERGLTSTPWLVARGRRGRCRPGAAPRGSRRCKLSPRRSARRPVARPYTSTHVSVDSCAQGLTVRAATAGRGAESRAHWHVRRAWTASIGPRWSFTCEVPRRRRSSNPTASTERVLVCDPMELVCTEPPGPGEQCPQGQCTSDSLCVDGVCALLPGNGEPCGSFGCAAGLRCDYTTNTCAPPVGEGEPCFYLEDCAEGLLCNPDTLVCTPLPGKGDDCPLGWAQPIRCGSKAPAPRPRRSHGPTLLHLPLRRPCDEPAEPALPRGHRPEDCEKHVSPVDFAE